MWSPEGHVFPNGLPFWHPAGQILPLSWGRLQYEFLHQNFSIGGSLVCLVWAFFPFSSPPPFFCAGETDPGPRVFQSNTEPHSQCDNFWRFSSLTPLLRYIPWDYLQSLGLTDRATQPHALSIECTLYPLRWTAKNLLGPQASILTCLALLIFSSEFAHDITWHGYLESDLSLSYLQCRWGLGNPRSKTPNVTYGSPHITATTMASPVSWPFPDSCPSVGHSLVLWNILRGASGHHLQNCQFFSFQFVLCSQLNWWAPPSSLGALNEFLFSSVTSCQLSHPFLSPMHPFSWSLVEMKMQVENQKRSKWGKKGYGLCQSIVGVTTTDSRCPPGCDIQPQVSSMKQAGCSRPNVLVSSKDVSHNLSLHAKQFLGSIVLVICTTGRVFSLKEEERNKMDLSLLTSYYITHTSSS